MYQIHDYVFSHFKICYLKYDIKHIFCITYTLKFKHMFSQHFLSHNFHLILNNDIYLKSATKQALNFLFQENYTI